MSKHSVRGGNVAGLLERFAQLQEKARARTGRTFPIIVIQEAGLTAFGFIVCCRMKGSRATWSIQPRLQHHVDAGARRLTGSTVRRCFAHYWRISAANLGVRDGQSADPEEEDRRRLCRERKVLTNERVQHVNRIKGLLFGKAYPATSRCAAIDGNSSTS